MGRWVSALLGSGRAWTGLVGLHVECLCRVNGEGNTKFAEVISMGASDRTMRLGKGLAGLDLVGSGLIWVAICKLSIKQGPQEETRCQQTTLEVYQQMTGPGPLHGTRQPKTLKEWMTKRP